MTGTDETETAEGIATRIVRRAKPWFDGTADDDDHKRAALTKAIAAAIQSERASASRQVAEALERAAKICDETLRLYRISPQTDYAIGAGFVAEHVAHEIRSLIPTLAKGERK